MFSEPEHPTCVETTGRFDMVKGVRTWMHGQDCPRPAGPDPDRDARREIYRDRERRRAARALDRYFTAMHSDSDGSPFVAGERFVEQVGDYVLARLGSTCLNGPEHPCTDVMTVGEAYDRLHQKADYGVSPGCGHYGCRGDAECQNEPAHPEGAHDV